MSKNPFTPVFGQVPIQMAGRTAIVDEMRNAFEDGPGNPNLCTIFQGARSTGKTALLLLLGREAEQRGWIAVASTAVPGMLEDLYEQAVRKASELVDSAPKRQVTGLSLGNFLNIDWAASEQPRLNWRSRMTALLDLLSETDTGLVLTVDEIDPNLDEVVQLATVFQHFVGEERKVALLMAGLPHRVSALLAGKSISFLRRANQEVLGSIPDADVAYAFAETINLGGKSITDGALEEAVSAIDGFPFMMQLVGYRSWNVADDNLAIGPEDVRRGIELARSDMENRVLKATLDELSNRDLDVLTAMLASVGPCNAAFIGKQTGMSSGNVSNYRKRLLEQGVIEETGRGKIDFALPLLRDYLPTYLEKNI